MSGDENVELEAAIADARPDDPAALALARARIERSLFGELAPGFGRFRVLERLGHGGMGVVYAAYDPQLDRGVALKMIEVGEGAHDAALLEAKALAKLAHPNVVPVFDVGIEAGRVYIVMEHVRGVTLREWCKERPASAIIEAYRQAGAGLAAAHAAGLIHRDVKPDNILVGDDDRVRVVDFGLACEATAVIGRGAGTPRYMAPEQKTSAAITPAVDQYSFCVSLGEALGDSPPRWVAALLERGRAPNPDERYPSMHALVRALGRDPARIVRRRIAIAGGVVAVVALVALARSRSDGVEVCGGGDGQLAMAWHPVARQAALGRLSAFGAYGRELAVHVGKALDANAEQWVTGYRGACLDHRRGAQSDTMFDRRTICLHRGRAALSEIGHIVESATPASLPDVALAVAALPEPQACGDLAALAVGDMPPAPVAARVGAFRETIARARVLVAAGHFADARASLRPIITEARTLGFPPVLAEALLVDGHAAMSLDEPAATAALREATTLSVAAGLSAFAIEAWARRAWIEGTTHGPDAAIAGVDVIEAMASAKDADHFARALLFNNLGSLALASRNRAEANRRFDAASREAPHVHGPDAIELLAVSANAILAADDPTRDDARFAAIVHELGTRLGENHPFTLQMRALRATSTMRALPDARRELEATCTLQEMHPSLATQIAVCWAELADLYADLDDIAGAARFADRAVATGVDLSPDAPDFAGYARWWHGDVDGARLAFETALAALPVRADEPWYDTFARAKIQLGLARLTSSPVLLEAVVAALSRTTEHSRVVAITRRLARAQAELAKLR